jgi:hypothetical protein
MTLDPQTAKDHRPDRASWVKEPYLGVQQRVSPGLSAQLLCGDDNDVAHSSLASYYGLVLHLTTRTAFPHRENLVFPLCGLPFPEITSNIIVTPLFSWTNFTRALQEAGGCQTPTSSSRSCHRSVHLHLLSAAIIFGIGLETAEEPYSCGGYILVLSVFTLRLTVDSYTRPIQEGQEMLFSTFIFAVVLYLSRCVKGTPTLSSQFILPPLLSLEKLSLVRANAINISTHRSVTASSPPSTFLTDD